MNFVAGVVVDRSRDLLASNMGDVLSLRTSLKPTFYFIACLPLPSTSDLLCFP